MLLSKSLSTCVYPHPSSLTSPNSNFQPMGSPTGAFIPQDPPPTSVLEVGSPDPEPNPLTHLHSPLKIVNGHVLGLCVLGGFRVGCSRGVGSRLACQGRLRRAQPFMLCFVFNTPSTQSLGLPAQSNRFETLNLCCSLHRVCVKLVPPQSTEISCQLRVLLL